ncbi:MAG: peptide deformylase [Kaiparowitsia implicata GSE-PSE-MK54-09C]|nr:peptide deformylase [Kaiparowitsia implicata GSE-PSE-MK54-09C]
MTHPLPIVELGDPSLRQTAAPVRWVQDPWVRAIAQHLLTTLTASNGVGIAAPQVGVLLRILVVASRPNPRYPHAPEMEPIVMVNPYLVSYSDEVEKGWEGCLSIPGIRGLVPRYRNVEIGYTTLDGEAKRHELREFPARIFQHEFDHLHGIVFLDRVESTHDLVTEREFHKRHVQTLPSESLVLIGQQ